MVNRLDLIQEESPGSAEQRGQLTAAESNLKESATEKKPPFLR